jgi:alkyldihydroxyacetonephosphate synthase
MAEHRRSHWGWGYEDVQAGAEERRAAAPGMTAHLGFGRAEPLEPVRLEDADLPEPRLAPPPGAPAHLFTAERHERATHAYGRAYRDVVRAFHGRFDHAPDLVARPQDEADVEKLLEWAAGAGAAVIPFGGGTSVVGGVEARVGDRYAGAVAMDLTALDRVLEVDEVSGAARIQAGAAGPVLEEQLAERGLTLRFYPQSFELSTLGGWVATRAGGHFATGPTHIDDLVESVRAITPAGAWESRRLPASGAGPSPDRLLLGSEGILGVITEAWVRVRPRPTARAGASVTFASFGDGAEAMRAIVQSGLRPANCRLIDPSEAQLTGAGDGDRALLVLGFEDPGTDPAALLRDALARCTEYGGEAREGSGGAAASWREAFLRAPYIRDTLVSMAILSETFETAITWDRLETLRERVTGEVEAALRERCGGGRVSCRLTHAYPDGAAPYFTVLAPARPGEEVATWDAVKAVAGEAILGAGGTITHHHAVGRDHRPWYDRQRPEPFAAALRAAKAALDPGALLNPGVLIDP